MTQAFWGEGWPVKLSPFPLLFSKMAAQWMVLEPQYIHTILCLPSPIPSHWIPPPGIYSSNLGLRNCQAFLRWVWWYLIFNSHSINQPTLLRVTLCPNHINSPPLISPISAVSYLHNSLNHSWRLLEKGYSEELGPLHAPCLTLQLPTLLWDKSFCEISSSQEGNEAKAILLSLLPSPYLKRLHIQHFGLHGVTQTPCLTMRSLCLC